MIKFAKLCSGEELLADVTEEDDQYVLKNPVRVVMAADQVGMIPWPMFAVISETKEVKLQKSHVLLLADALDSELTNAYSARFGSGIVLAPSLEAAGLGDPSRIIIE